MINTVLFCILCLLILLLIINTKEHFADNKYWVTKYPNYLSRLYKPIYTYVFYDAYNRDINVHRHYRIGFYSLDSTISNISSSLIIENNINEYINKSTNVRSIIQKNQFYNIDNRTPLVSQKSIDQFKIFNGNDISIKSEWEWFLYTHRDRVKDFGNWIYYCNSFSDYMTRNMYTFTSVLYKNYDEMFNDFIDGKLDFFISPKTENINQNDNFSFLYTKVLDLGYLVPKIFKTNNIHNNYVVNIYENNSLYNEYYTKYFTKYHIHKKNITYNYYNELMCFSKFPNEIHLYGVLKCSNIKKKDSIPFSIYTHSTQSKYCIQKKNYIQIYNMFRNLKNNYLNLINTNLNSY